VGAWGEGMRRPIVHRRSVNFRRPPWSTRHASCGCKRPMGSESASRAEDVREPDPGVLGRNGGPMHSAANGEFEQSVARYVFKRRSRSGGHTSPRIGGLRRHMPATTIGSVNVVSSGKIDAHLVIVKDRGRSERCRRGCVRRRCGTKWPRIHLRCEAGRCHHRRHSPSRVHSWNLSP